MFQLERDLSREPQQPVAVGSSPFIPSDPVPSLTGVKDEYNPLRPNDYEEITKKKKEQRQKEDDERKRDRGDDFDRNRFVTQLPDPCYSILLHPRLYSCPCVDILVGISVDSPN